MIQAFVANIIKTLRDGFAGTMSNPASRILDGPAEAPTAAQVPRLFLYMGDVVFEHHHRDTNSSQPRPMEIRQNIVLNQGAGPYPLAKTPLDKSLLCKVQFSLVAGGRRRLLQEGKDFSIDYQNASMSFPQTLAGAESMSLRYSYVGIFTLREFQQELMMEVYDDTAAKVENLATLATAMILSNHDDLLDDFNLQNPVPHIANDYVTEHSLSQIVPSGSKMERLDGSNLFKLRMVFTVQGQAKYVKAQPGGFGIIEKIHSPGKISTDPVDVDIDVE